MRDPIFFLITAGVDKPLRSFLCVAKRETKIDPRLGRRLDLCEHVIAIERHNRLAGTSLHIFAGGQSEL